MDSYSKVKAMLRRRDERTKELRQGLKGSTQTQRKALIERALTVQFDKQQGRGA